MRARVQKWGNSLALRIPKPFAEESNLRENSPVDISLRRGTIVIVPVEEPTVSLAQLIGAITPENRHDETETGAAVGHEVC